MKLVIQDNLQRELKNILPVVAFVVMGVVVLVVLMMMAMVVINR